MFYFFYQCVYMVVFLFNIVIYVFLLCLCILIVCLCIFIVPGGALQLPWLRFFRVFSSVVRQMPGYNLQKRGTARTLPKFCVVLYIICFVSLCVLFVCKCVLYYCHLVAAQLQLTNISYHIIQLMVLTYTTLSIHQAWYVWMPKQMLTINCTVTSDLPKGFST